MKRRLLITGATGEIGSSLSKFFSKQDIYLILAGRNIDKLNDLKKSLSPHTAEIVLAQIDYNDSSSYKNIENSIDNKLNGVVLIPPRISQTQNCMLSKEEWIDVFQNVFINPLEFFKTLIPLLVSGGSSKVVILSG